MKVSTEAADEGKDETPLEFDDTFDNSASVDEDFDEQGDMGYF